MLNSTFQHLPNIGAHRERQLWRAGVLSWEDFRHRASGTQLSFLNNLNESADILESSRAALRDENVDFFANSLARQEHYRIALAFPHRTLFLDIETTGLSRYYDDITLIGWCLNGKYGYWVRGEDLTPFEQALSTSSVLVTFNGSLFDLPFLRSEFPPLTFPAAHIDLRFLLKRVGISGGQKSIEKRLGIGRPPGIVELTSSIAPLLWYRFIRGDLESGKRLVVYNRADVLGMCRLFDIAVRRIARRSKIPRAIVPTTTFTVATSAGPVTLSESTVLVARASVRSERLQITDLIPRSSLSSLRIVGIDLTGSESRPSGWASFLGSEVVTRRIGSDNDLVEATTQAQPCIVSIDSPLSLPDGRTIASDDDPGRFQFGITRACERILRKRGVNVYPSLIRSMQGLTTRGIALSTRLRALGIPVIESFPGAAQDILAIPRKRASLELLKSGLVEFGLQGAFTETMVSHDELDAITSALVGVFFWAGRVEWLGNETEDYLIVPSRQPRSMWLQRLAIGLSGEIHAGKTTAGRWISAAGFTYSRPSLVLEDILVRSGHEPTRGALQALGSRLRESPGQRWLIQQTLARCGSAGRVVIDGLRFPEDHAFMIERFGPAFHHVHIDAPLEARLDRYVRLGGHADEYASITNHAVEQGTPRLRNFATDIISNDKSLSRFRAAIDAMLRNTHGALAPTLFDVTPRDV